MSLYSDASYLINCMRRGWYEKWRENGWLNYRNQAVANKDLWERLLEAAQPASTLEEDQGASKDPGPAQVRQRPGRRTRRGRQEQGNQTINAVVTMTEMTPAIHILHCLLALSCYNGFYVRRRRKGELPSRSSISFSSHAFGLIAESTTDSTMKLLTKTSSRSASLIRCVVDTSLS